ncbi:MAG: hypothetical protein U1F42_11165, partial [Candidatus Competibacteraceae bacterium]
MRKLLTVLGIITVILLLLAGGVGGYLWYNTKQQVDQLVMMAKPFADITYGGVNVWPTGSIGINRIQILPHIINDSVTIGAIDFKAPNILALLNIKRKLNDGKLPEAMSLSITDLTLAVNGGILSPPIVTAQKRSPFDGLDALGCGPVTQFGGNEWQEMGYDNLTSS